MKSALPNHEEDRRWRRRRPRSDRHAAASLRVLPMVLVALSTIFLVSAHAQTDTVSVPSDLPTEGNFNTAVQAAIEGLVKISVDVKVVNGNNPTVFALNQNYPNPFNPTTAVSYQLPVASEVKLVAYDMLGREVAVFVNERKAPGSYEAQFSAGGGSASGGDAPELACGVYVYRLSAGQYVESRKMVLLK
jgi:hypothetical protein